MGGHRIQRIPPTERKGRVHTSTVTVAITSDLGSPQTDIPKSDLKIEWYSGTGCGGQNRNKVQSSCRITHLPSGIIATAQTRSRINSEKLAMENIQAKVTEIFKNKQTAAISSDRKEQVGSGMRGDKRRTYRFQDDSVKDHETLKSSSVKQVMNGRFDLLWK